MNLRTELQFSFVTFAFFIVHSFKNKENKNLGERVSSLQRFVAVLLLAEHRCRHRSWFSVRRSIITDLSFYNWVAHLFKRKENKHSRKRVSSLQRFVAGLLLAEHRSRRQSWLSGGRSTLTDLSFYNWVDVLNLNDQVLIAKHMLEASLMDPIWAKRKNCRSCCSGRRSAVSDFRFYNWKRCSLWRTDRLKKKRYVPALYMF